jgi:Ca2+-binding EF-hand superfamily protein
MLSSPRVMRDRFVIPPATTGMRPGSSQTAAARRRAVLLILIPLVATSFGLGCTRQNPSPRDGDVIETSASHSSDEELKSIPSSGAPPDDTISNVPRESAEVPSGIGEGQMAAMSAREDVLGDAELETPGDDEVSDAPDEGAMDSEGAAEGVERILVLARGGPLVLDVVLSVDGVSPYEAMDQLLTEVLSSARQDGEDQVAWDTLLASPIVQYGQLGNLMAEDESQRMQLKRMYDANRDGIVDRAELARFLTRNAGGARPFQLRSANYYRDIHRRESPVGHILDQNGDGIVDEQEIQEAASQLMRFDTSDLERLSPDDFPQAAADQPAPLTRRISNLPDPVIALRQVRDSAQLLYEMEEVYALGQSIMVDDMPQQRDRFALIDRSGDGVWQADEMECWWEVEPDLVVALRFGESLEVLDVSEPLRSRMRELVVRADRVIVELPEIQLTIVLRDAVGSGSDVTARATQGQVRARAGYDRDAWFAVLDQDHDGRLTSRELAMVTTRLQSFDRDGDGRLDFDELPDVMLIVFARGAPQEDSETFQIPRVPSPTASGPAWFRAMDRNGDGVISRREFLGGAEQFDELDKNGDGFLDLEELQQLSIHEESELPE